MKKYFMLSAVLYFLLQSFPVSGQITLTEVMYDPAENENYYEFIEIYNLSSTDSINLSGWSVSDGSDSDLIIEVEQGLIIAPLQFAILLDPGYFDNDPVYAILIPQEALVLTINNSTFGSGGLSNSTTETISLLDVTGDTISTYTYSLGNTSGYSDEKIILTESNATSNWADSKILHGTPGYKNSVSPVDYDLSVSSNTIWFTPENPLISDSVLIQVVVKNSGSKTATNFQTNFYVDINSDSVPEAQEQIGSILNDTDSMKTMDSLVVSLEWSDFQPGENIIIVEVSFLKDEKPENNRAWKSFFVRYTENLVVINEVMFQPSDDRFEWIELYNPSDLSIDLKNWQLSDSRIETKNVITQNSIFIEPDGYVIIAKDKNLEDKYPDITVPVIIPSAWSGLNNDYDAVVLYDISGSKIDSMIYFENWNAEEDVSLERFDYEWSSTDYSNWRPSENINGATPGFKNSISPFDYDLAIQEISFNPTAPAPNSSVVISATVENVGRETFDQFSVRFFNDTNFDSILTDNELIGEILTYADSIYRYDEVEIQVEYFNTTSGVQNIYAVLDLADENEINNQLMKQLFVSFKSECVVINEIMYSPFSEQPEWIELCNRSASAIDLQNWKFSDSDSSSKYMLSNSSLIIEPDSFLVITRDSLSIEVFDTPTYSFVLCSKFPLLNDDGDAIFLFDLNEKVIDYVEYQTNWGGGEGISLERINPQIASMDSSNWSSCVYERGGSPGEKNSIFIEIVPSSASVSVSPNPFSPDDDAFEDAALISYRLPMTTSNINLKIYDVRGRLVRYLKNNSPSGAEGSVIWNGRDDDGYVCRMGIYIIYLEGLNESKGVVVSHKKTVVLAGKL